MIVFCFIEQRSFYVFVCGRGPVWNGLINPTFNILTPKQPLSGSFCKRFAKVFLQLTSEWLTITFCKRFCRFYYYYLDVESPLRKGPLSTEPRETREMTAARQVYCATGLWLASLLATLRAARATVVSCKLKLLSSCVLILV